MHKKLGICCILLGAALIGSALLLFGYNRAEDAQAGAASHEAVAAIQEKIEQQQTVSMPAVPEKTQTSTSPEPNMDAPVEEEAESTAVAAVTMVGDYEYLGVLDLPALELSLPVMASWDETRLKLAPCRQFGSVETDDLVIAAHNYVNHFGSLGMLKEGDSVTFTAMDGTQTNYTVAKSQTIQPDEVEKVEQSGYALVLYTCTYGRQARIAVYCDKSE